MPVLRVKTKINWKQLNEGENLINDFFVLLYNDFIVNIYIQLDWEQVFTTYQSLSIQIH